MLGHTIQYNYCMESHWVFLYSIRRKFHTTMLGLHSLLCIHLLREQVVEYEDSEQNQRNGRDHEETC